MTRGQDWHETGSPISRPEQMQQGRSQRVRELQHLGFLSRYISVIALQPGALVAVLGPPGMQWRGSRPAPKSAPPWHDGRGCEGREKRKEEVCIIAQGVQCNKLISASSVNKCK